MFRSRVYLPFSLILSFQLLGASLAYGQEHLILDSFKGFAFDGKIILQWTIKKGFTCQGIDVYRSNDNINYTKVGTIFGQCGSRDEATNFTWEDNAPSPNAINYYELEMGLEGRTSPPLEIFFLNIQEQSSLVVPNPSSEKTTVRFSNDGNLPHQLKIYDLQGRKIGTYYTSTDRFDIDISILNEKNASMLLYVISSSKEEFITNGKILLSKN